MLNVNPSYNINACRPTDKKRHVLVCECVCELMPWFYRDFCKCLPWFIAILTGFSVSYCEVLMECVCPMWVGLSDVRMFWKEQETETFFWVRRCLKTAELSELLRNNSCQNIVVYCRLPWRLACCCCWCWCRWTRSRLGCHIMKCYSETRWCRQDAYQPLRRNQLVSNTRHNNNK